VEEYADEVFGLLNDGAHMYFCGLKGMMPGILEMLERVAKEKGLNFEEFVEKLKHNNQWHVEVRGVAAAAAGRGGNQACRLVALCDRWLQGGQQWGTAGCGRML
jgi:hypothetical protein